jgi:hypothetical protein
MLRPQITALDGFHVIIYRYPFCRKKDAFWTDMYQNSNTYPEEVISGWHSGFLERGEAYTGAVVVWTFSPSKRQVSMAKDIFPDAEVIHLYEGA